MLYATLFAGITLHDVNFIWWPLTGHISMLRHVSSNSVIVASAALRIILILFSTWQDEHSSVRYTDIDYDVFTDAAKFVSEGGSPYDRSTFRYTPLLAYLMLPNLSLHIAFGKLLFSAADIAVAVLVQHIVKQKCDSQGLPASMTHHITLIALAAWLFNPYTATISTRGNGDSLVVLMQLGVLLLVRTRQKTHGEAASGDARACSELSSMDSEVTAPGTGRMALAGALYGLLVHWRVFPVIHGPSLILHLWSQSHRAPHRLRTWLQKCLAFGVPALAIFFGLGAVFYRLYGDPFLHETFLYHAGRQDPRHNFSPHFLFTYLYHFGPVDAAGQPLRPAVPLWLNPGASAPACMAVALLATAWAFTDDLDVTWLLSTIVFVALNKVSTAQYFVWFLGIFPVVLPAVYAGWGRLQWAAIASFVGEPVFKTVWGVGLVLMTSQVLLYGAIVHAVASPKKLKAA